MSILFFFFLPHCHISLTDPMATYQVDPRSYEIDWENTLRKAAFLRSAFSEIQGTQIFIFWKVWFWDVSPLLVNVTKVCPLDLRDAKNNEEANNFSFTRYWQNKWFEIEKLLICKHHLGGYSELRQIYNTEAYAGKDPRVVHLGVDYTSHAGHPGAAPNFNFEKNSFRILETISIFEKIVILKLFIVRFLRSKIFT